MRASPLIGDIHPDTIADIRLRLGDEIRGALRKKPAAFTPETVTDIQVEALLVFLHGVNVPIYRVGIDWKRFALSGQDGIVFFYQPGWGMGTSDNNDLTRLVFIAHDRGFSVALKPKSKDALQVYIYKMKRWEGEAGSWNGMHPTLEQARRAYLAGEYVPQDNDPADFIDIAEADADAAARYYQEGERAFKPAYAHPSVENPIPTRYPAGSRKNLHYRRGLMDARTEYLKENPNG